MMNSDLKTIKQLGNFSDLLIDSKTERQGFNTSEAQCSILDKTVLEKPKQEKFVQAKLGKSIQDSSIEEKLMEDKSMLEKSNQEKPIQEKPMQVEQKENKAKPTANKTGFPNVTGYSEGVVRSTRGPQDPVITQYSIRGSQQTRNGYMVYTEETTQQTRNGYRIYTEETHIVHKLGNLGASLHHKK